jgi:hypothetical protein
MALSFSVPDSVLASTLAHYRNNFEDNIMKSIPLFYKLYDAGKKETISGGESIVVPLRYAKNATVAGYSGYGTLDTTPQETNTAAKYNWKQVGGTVAISGKEVRQNSGKEQVINLLKEKVSVLEDSVKEYMNGKLFAASTTDSGTDPHGLATIVATSGTVGGIAKATYSWWQSQTGTAASFAANGLAEMRNIFNDCSVYSAGDHPDFIITTQTVFEYYEGVLQPQERFQDSKTADGGFQNLLFKGVPLTWDPNCTASKMYFLNTKYLKLAVHKDADFNFSEFQEPENQDAKVAKMIWMGELCASNCAKQGVLSITAA